MLRMDACGSSNVYRVPLEILIGPLAILLHSDGSILALASTCRYLRAALFPHIVKGRTVVFDTSQRSAHRVRQSIRFLSAFAPCPEKLKNFSSAVISLGSQGGVFIDLVFEVVLKLIQTVQHCEINLHSGAGIQPILLLSALESNGSLRSLTVRCFNSEQIDTYAGALAGGFLRDGFGRDLSTLKFGFHGNWRTSNLNPMTAKELGKGIQRKSSTIRNLEWHVRSSDVSAIEPFFRTCSALECLSLKFSYPPESYSLCEVLRSLGENKVAKLRTLELSAAPLTSSDVDLFTAALLAGGAFKSLETLIQRNAFTVQHVGNAVLHSSSIRSLQISIAHASSFDCLHRAFAINSSLTSLDISIVEYNSVLVESLAKTIGSSKSIEKVSVGVEFSYTAVKYDLTPLVQTWTDRRYRPASLKELILEGRFLGDTESSLATLKDLIEALPSIRSIMFLFQKASKESSQKILAIEEELGKQGRRVSLSQLETAPILY
ncbi:hypothetical protein BJ742DRAFT_292096 [Cladochytrium replicatum]|nr:hypothetical protein BJ742DRAFT_292096 [Cladochytrium replicatum]